MYLYIIIINTALLLTIKTTAAFKKLNLFLSISIWSRATVCRRAHLPFNPFSEERDPAVDSVSPGQSALVTKTDLTNEYMLGSALVSQRASGVSLAEIFRLVQKPPSLPCNCTKIQG